MTRLSEPVTYPTARPHPFDPPQVLREIRERQPIVRFRYPDGRLGWLVTSHELAKSVLKDGRFSVAGDIRKTPHPIVDPAVSRRLFDPMSDEDFRHQMCGNFMAMDPPDHTRFRRLFAPGFGVRGVEKVRPQVERVVEHCLDVMETASPPVDVTSALALPVSIRSQCALLGAPQSDADEIARLNAIHLEVVNGSSPGAARFSAGGAFRDRIVDLVAQKRAHPADDLISLAIRSGALTDDEIVSTISFVLIAGQDVSAGMIATSVFALLCHPTQLRALRRGSVSLDDAVEELLRYLAVFQFAVTRKALADIDLAGRKVNRGDYVTVSLPAANRDPQRWPAPDALSLDRGARGHLAFGQGIHICLGQHLARLELRAVLAGLMRRFPSLRLAVPAEDIPIYDGKYVVYSVRALPVEW